MVGSGKLTAPIAVAKQRRARAMVTSAAVAAAAAVALTAVGLDLGWSVLKRAYASVLEVR